MLLLQDLSVGYAKPILSSLNIDIDKGEFVGVLGSNGCGKTTLVRTLTRSLPPLCGNIKIDGKDISAMSASDFSKHIALVGQDVWHSFDYTAIEVVLMGRYSHMNRFSVESERDIDIAIKALHDVGLENMQKRPITTLSGGERQRVMIAKAIAQQADVLILDEPTSHLDINHAIEIMDMISKIDKTIVAVMHDINLAAKYCSRMILLAGGSIVADGSATDVLTEQNIKSVFSADITVSINHKNGRPFVIY